MPSIVDIVEILPFLPNRFPQPLIDRVLECDPGRSISGYKNVSMNEPYFQGHFPSYPVMPGVLVIEALVQLCAVLAVASGKLPLDGSMRLLFPGIPSCRFKRQVVPGDRLMLECTIPQDAADLTRFDIRALVEGAVAAEGVVSARLEPVAKS